MFIEPKYKCDICGKIEEADWTGLPHWDIPKGWVEEFINAWTEKHYCPKCIEKNSAD